MPHAENPDSAVVDQVLRDWRVVDSGGTVGEKSEALASPKTPENSSLEFLCNTFPKRSRQALADALEASKGDVDAAIDELLAADVLAQETSKMEPQQAQPVRQSGLDIDALERGLGAGRQRRTKGKKTKPVTVSLTGPQLEHKDTHTKAAPKTDAELAQQIQDDERAAADADEPSVADQQWLLASSTLAQLGSLLSLPQIQVQSIFNKASFNLHVAIARAIEAARTTDEGVAAAAETDFEAVCEMIGAISGHEVREVRPVLAAAHGSQDAALDLLQLCDTVAENAASRRPDALDPLGRVMVPPVATMPKISTTAPAPAPTSAAAAAMRSGAIATVLPASAAHVVIPDSVDELATMEECRARAATYTARRNELLRTATASARAHRGTVAAGASMVYADEARQMHEKARKWQKRAADAAARERLDPSEVEAYIDLHELSVHEALTVVQQGVRRWASSSPELRAPLAIITGRGAHSRRQQAVIRPAVARMLAQQGFVVDADSDPGQLLVKRRR